MTDPRIDSHTSGDPLRHWGMEQLEAGLAALPQAPRDQGRVALLVSRGEGGLRATPGAARLTEDQGLVGDNWSSESDGDAETQLTAVEVRLAEIIANGQSLALFGDQLFLDLDLSQENLPTGSQLRVGQAVLEVSPQPHNGCQKFRSRFGTAALRFVQRPDLRHRNFRGIYLRVITEGLVAVDDPVTVLRRGPRPDLRRDA